MTKQNFFITASTITLVALMATASVAQSPGGAGAGSATEQRQGNGGAAQGDTQSGPNASARAQENAAPSSAVQGQNNKSADGDGRGSLAGDDKGKNRAAQRDTETKPRASERAEERASPKSRVQSKEDTPKAYDRAREKASPKSAVQGEKKADDESRRSRAADDKTNDATKKQAERDQGKDRDRSASDDATKDGRDERARREATDGDQQRRDRAEGDRGDRAADRVQLSEQKRKTVRERMATRARANRVTAVDFDIRVGVNVPRTRTFYTLPQDVIEIVPEYRGYRYMYVRDEIVIVHPTNYVIVAVIGGDGRVGSRSGCRITLASDDRVFVREHVDLGARVRLDIGGLSLGMDLPNTVELRTLPDVIVERCPDLRDHQYFVHQENVVIVEPRTREVVLIIED